MKKLIALLSFAAALAVAAAPGEVHKGTLTFVWDAPSEEQNVEGYKLWVTTNLPPGITLPIPTDDSLQSVTLPPSSVPMFQPLMEIAGDATSVTVTNIWSQLGTWAFFVLTATNQVGESPFSNPVALVAPLSGRGGLELRLNR